MRIFILALGTRGELELFLTLGRELHRRGHKVLVGASPFQVLQAQQAGLDWTIVGNGTFAEQRAALQALASVPDRIQRVRTYAENWLLPQLGASMEHIQALAERVDYVISDLKLLLRRATGLPIPGAWVTCEPSLSAENREEHDASPDPVSILHLVAMNPRLVDPQEQWGPRYQFTGFWKTEPISTTETPTELLVLPPTTPALESPLPPTTTPEPEIDPALAAFVQAGPPPVVLAMGSLVMFDAPRLAQTFAEAVRLTGQRGVLVAGWSGVSLPAPAAAAAALVAGWVAPTALAPTTAPVFSVDEAPYDWLFPRASCVIHAGGVGTLAAVLRAGVPSILLPQVPSQEIMGRLLESAGLMAGSFDTTSLDPTALAGALRRALTDETLRQSCRQWQAEVADEPGVQAAVELIDHHSKGLPPPPVIKGRWGRARSQGGW